MIAMPTLTVAIKPCVSRPRKGEAVTVGETTLTRMGIETNREIAGTEAGLSVPSRLCYSFDVVVAHNNV
jgi:hypothetical protein